MSLRGAAAIVGIGEIPTRRTYPGRTTHSLLTEASRLAIRDAGLRKKDIDGLVTCGTDISPMDLAEYMGLSVSFSEGVTQYGASGTQSIVIAAVAIQAGLATTVLCVMGGARDPDAPGMGTGSEGGPAPASKTTEFETPFGPGGGRKHRLRPDEAAPHARVRDHRRAVRAHRRQPEIQRTDERERRLPRTAHLRR